MQRNVTVRLALAGSNASSDLAECAPEATDRRGGDWEVGTYTARSRSLRDVSRCTPGDAKSAEVRTSCRPDRGSPTAPLYEPAPDQIGDRQQVAETPPLNDSVSLVLRAAHERCPNEVCRERGEPRDRDDSREEFSREQHQSAYQTAKNVRREKRIRAAPVRRHQRQPYPQNKDSSACSKAIPQMITRSKC